MAAVEDHLEQAYEECRAITFRHAKTFYFASHFLPHHKRQACYAVYAFCRHVDDLVDDEVASNNGVADTTVVERAIGECRAALDHVYAGRTCDMPTMLAWSDTLRRFEIDRKLPGLLIEGVLTDLRATIRLETFEELYDYCYKVASVVGLMTCGIFGYRDPRALGHAIDLGVAMQLTNILRDIGEDYARDRIYIPREELQRFGVEEEGIARGRICTNFRRMMAFQIERAHGYYESAERGIPMLDRDSRLTVSLMSHNYRRILGAIERNSYDVFSRRACIPLYRKLFSIPPLWYASTRA